MSQGMAAQCFEPSRESGEDWLFAVQDECADHPGSGDKRQNCGEGQVILSQQASRIVQQVAEDQEQGSVQDQPRRSQEYTFGHRLLSFLQQSAAVDINPNHPLCWAFWRGPVYAGTWRNC